MTLWNSVCALNNRCIHVQYIHNRLYCCLLSLTSTNSVPDGEASSEEDDEPIGPDENIYDDPDDDDDPYSYVLVCVCVGGSISQHA